jgi:hypothetical protein
MIIVEFRLVGKPRQYRALDEAIRTTQSLQDKCVRYWQDTRGVTPYDLNKYWRGPGVRVRLRAQAERHGPPGGGRAGGCRHHALLQELACEVPRALAVGVSKW